MLCACLLPTNRTKIDGNTRIKFWGNKENCITKESIIFIYPVYTLNSYFISNRDAQALEENKQR